MSAPAPLKFTLLSRLIIVFAFAVSIITWATHIAYAEFEKNQIELLNDHSDAIRMSLAKDADIDWVTVNYVPDCGLLVYIRINQPMSVMLADWISGKLVRFDDYISQLNSDEKIYVLIESKLDASIMHAMEIDPDQISSPTSIQVVDAHDLPAELRTMCERAHQWVFEKELRPIPLQLETDSESMVMTEDVHFR